MKYKQHSGDQTGNFAKEKHKVTRSVMLFIDMIIHSKQEKPCKMAWSRHDFIYHQGGTMKKATMYFETTTLLRTCKFTSSDNKKANETKNENRMTEKKEMKG